MGCWALSRITPSIKVCAQVAGKKMKTTNTRSERGDMRLLNPTAKPGYFPGILIFSRAGD
jgi:hypothetical protein